ncbi:LAQU0S04e02674g1_1 [Lachancea quebecensis]|uniref:LAQU0S04e02674g1_1 n=1 Tax=Lachancea quebecensis TaxID=1654605 RepID=A0A0P1KQK1_9SACH|nr:LAQU0S04e02674g1_1 [Lachancea quebecensis]
MSIENSFIGEFPSSIWHLDPAVVSPGHNACLFVFIPGNPGLIEYYVPFLQQIHEKNPDWEILGISHAGMNSRNDISCPVYTLQEQINHKIDVINSYAREHKKITIMGHSVGAFIAQKVLTSGLLRGEVSRIGLLTPTVIDIHRSEKGLKMASITERFPRFHELVSILDWITFEKFFPTFLTDWVISHFADDPKTCLGAATRLLLTNSRFVKQALGLAAEEMRVIRSDWVYQKNFLHHCETNGTKIWWLFSENDHWVSNETRKDLIHFYERHSSPQMVSIDVSTTIEHAFVRKHAQVVVQHYF